MNYTGFPVHDSIVSGQALTERVLSKYDLPSPISCHYYTLGHNDTYVVRAGKSTYYLRVYRYGWRTKKEIQAELDMLIYLHQRRLPTSYPLKRKDGSYLNRISVSEGVRYAALFSNAPGTPVGMDGSYCRTYGELVGRVHACLDKAPDDDRRFHLDFSHLIDEALYYTKPLMEHRKEDFDYLTNVGRELWERIEDLLPKTKPEYGSCHGDHHGGNLHVDEKGQMTLYDFDCYGYGYRAYDIAVFLWNRALNFGVRGIGKAKVTRRWNAFLKGYAKTRTVSDRELDATRVFVPIRHIWMVGSHTQKAETFGHSWMNDGYFNNHIDFIKRWIESNKIL